MGFVEWTVGLAGFLTLFSVLHGVYVAIALLHDKVISRVTWGGVAAWLGANFALWWILCAVSWILLRGLPK